MNEKTADRRVRKTRKALREGLAVLMSQKSIKDISVRELTELVDINRATFYLHYQDVYDLQRHIVDEVIEEAVQLLDEYMPYGKKQPPREFFLAVLNYIEENSSQCKMLLSDNNNRMFIDKLSEVVRDKCLRIWLENFKIKDSGQALVYFYDFLVYGIIAVINRWVNEGMTTPPEELASTLELMAKYGVGFLEKI